MLKKLAIIFSCALALRLLLVFVAYHGDLNNNISWGTLAVERGLVNFYDGVNWPYSVPNQPPLTILLFALIRFIWQTLENTFWWLNLNFPAFPSPIIWFWEAKGMVLLIKLPSILADLGIGLFIYKYFDNIKKRSLGLTLSGIWLFNPIAIYNSSIWGQTDSIVNLLGMIAIFSLIRKKMVSFGVFITSSILFKASLIIFLPVLFFYALRQKFPISKWLKFVGACLVLIFIFSFVFHPEADFLYWLALLYKNRILPGEIGFLTANAFNFWWLVSPGRILDSAIFFGIPARFWGIIFVFLIQILVILWFKKKVSDKRFIYALALISMTAFIFLTRIHPRYLYPFFPLTTILIGLIPSILPIYIVASISHLLNIYYLFWAPSIPALEKLYLNPLFPNMLAITNIVMLVFLLRLLASRKI